MGVQDLSFKKSYPIEQFPAAGVHHGFWDAWKSLEPAVVAAISKVMAPYGNSHVYVTGHSLGASIASDAALDLKLTHGWDTSVVNFGSPRTGDHKYMRAVSQEVPTFWRVTHDDDIVPRAPPEL